jgi:dihydrofolate reductase
MSRKKVSSFIAMSLDGFIADKHGSISFLDPYNKPEEDHGYKEFFSKKDAIIIGANTYKTLLGFSQDLLYEGKETFVVTSQKLTRKGSNVQFYSGDIEELVEQLKAQDRSIYCDGGSQVLKTFFDHKLLDEIIVTIIPILLGEGVPLFTSKQRQDLVLHESKAFSDGLLQIHYLFK